MSVHPGALIRKGPAFFDFGYPGQALDAGFVPELALLAAHARLLRPVGWGAF
jgi:hypothetical protein